MRKSKTALLRPRSFVVAAVMGAALALPCEGSQIQPVEEKAITDISRYCQACWRNAHLHPDTWHDCTQEVFSRLLERVDTARWSEILKKDVEDHQEFLRAVDAVKKRVQRSRSLNSISGDVCDYRLQRTSKRNEIRDIIDQVGRDILSDRQRTILKLSSDGWSIPDIAAALKTPAARISDDKYKAICKLRSAIHVL